MYDTLIHSPPTADICLYPAAEIGSITSVQVLKIYNITIKQILGGVVQCRLVLLSGTVSMINAFLGALSEVLLYVKMQAALTASLVHNTRSVLL